MPRGINLLPKKEKTQKGLSLKAKKGVIVFLGLYIVVVIGVFLANFLISRQLSSLRSKRQALENQVKANEKKEQLLVLLKDRLSKEEKIIKERVDYKRIYKIIDSLRPDDVVFAELEIAGNGLTLSGEAKNLVSLRSFLEGVDNLEDEVYFVQMPSLERTKEAAYMFSLETTFDF